ncbi:hypothetical protein PHMEG_0005893 [Phytophthora megakarya]|uniref:Tyrosine-protein phosphatase domain-containing protein n=1 Tax=Phytophthora megakarya TaxID=4795 RepID=A0A225WQA3_9STRA|nr:hypothetical protein PHMEG_0005893 [Phytophthora megakarya]
MADDEPMHVTGRLHIGSIDAARNLDALQRLRVGGALALLGKGEEDAAVYRHSSAVSEGYADLGITRTTVEIEDSEDGDLLRRLPEILTALRKLMYDENEWSRGIAGRSRSASVLAAWMLINESKQQGVQDVVDRIRIVRPWIEINPYFMRDLHLFHTVLTLTDGPLDAENASLLEERTFPRLNFGANLVGGILKGTKTITMRLVSDVKGDRNSDLGDIFPHSIVAAATASSDGSLTRRQFAYLRIDQIETQELSTIAQTTLMKSGFSSTHEVLTVLKQYYPNVTATTPLLMLHFQCLHF